MGNYLRIGDVLPVAVTFLSHRIVSPVSASEIPSPLWRECIKKIWEVDPLVCPRCHTEMKIISFVVQSMYQKDTGTLGTMGVDHVETTAAISLEQ